MANQIKRSEIILANGTAAVISTSEIYPGEYETMLATPDFETEYRVLKSCDKESACICYISSCIRCRLG